MAYQITGNLEQIGEITSRESSNGGQPFQSRTFVIDATRFNPDTGEPWENHPKFELGSRNVNIIDGFRIGDRVTVDFVLRGVRYSDRQSGDTRYFTTVSAFRITPTELLQDTPPFMAASMRKGQDDRRGVQDEYSPRGNGGRYPSQETGEVNHVQIESDDMPF